MHAAINVSRHFRIHGPPDRANPKAQRNRPLPLAHWFKQCESREEALRCACVHSGIGMATLAGELGLKLARVSQLIARAERAARATAK